MSDSAKWNQWHIEAYITAKYNCIGRYCAGNPLSPVPHPCTPPPSTTTPCSKEQGCRRGRRGGLFFLDNTLPAWYFSRHGATQQQPATSHRTPAKNTRNWGHVGSKLGQLAQLWTNNGCIYRVCRDSGRQAPCEAATQKLDYGALLDISLMYSALVGWLARRPRPRGKWAKRETREKAARARRETRAEKFHWQGCEASGSTTKLINCIVNELESWLS